MLGDNPEKSTNPLKKAMRRRNAKAVAFAPPTFIEASDVEFTSEGEMEEGGIDYSSEEEDTVVQRSDVDPQDHNGEGIDTAVHAQAKELEEPEEAGTLEPSVQAEAEDHKSSEDALLVRSENSPVKGANPVAASEENVSRSRNGTVRNTDSFFKDDSIETKKISLTPNLLRDEMGKTNGGATDMKEVRTVNFLLLF